MAIEIDKMFTVNEDSIKHSIDIIVDQRLNFRLISKEKFIEIVKVDMSDIPFDGTIIERNKYIEEKAGEYLDKLEEKGKFKLDHSNSSEEVKKPNDNSKNENEDNDIDAESKDHIDTPII